jgi:deoxyribodipyrimidine photo-lyase
MSAPKTLVWFRKDLRIQDNPALLAASERGEIIPVFIWDPEAEGDWPPGAASQWWLHHALDALSEQLAKHKSKLIIRRGSSVEVLEDLLKQTHADAIYFNRRYEPAMLETDRNIKQSLRSEDIEVKSFNASLLYEPWTVSTQQDKPYKVYTPFWKRTQDHHDAPPKPCPEPESITSPSAWPDSDALEDLDLLPEIDWDSGFYDNWKPGEKHAHERLEAFLDDILTDYADTRNHPAVDGTSRLSPYLHFGELGPRQVWHAVRDYMEDGRRNLSQADKKQCWVYLKEIAWREFSYHVLFNFPHTPTDPLKPKFEAFNWIDMRQGRHLLEAWQKGKTGYPIVDAGMRQLWEIGWMHNRVRMITASFLVKDLRVHWLEGSKWFWDTLIDADLADNTMGWQWVAGCGADAQPFFRIFNPISQGEKFDPDGNYVRRFVPELKDLPDKYIHSPWKAPAEALERAGIKLGEDYPEPIVDHSEARDKAMEAYQPVRDQ